RSGTVGVSASSGASEEGALVADLPPCQYGRYVNPPSLLFPSSPDTSTHMSQRELLLLSPYRMPAQSSLSLGNEGVSSILNGYLALWPPAAIAGAVAPPKFTSPYDHEQPTAGHVYAVPEHPPLILPDDWDARVAQAGAAAFRATPEREATLGNVKTALANMT